MSQDASKTMSRAAFSRGWKLLIIQPWGWRYNQVDASGQPTTAAVTQMEFYYDKLKWAHPEAWWDVAQTYAQGNDWPSLNDLRQALRHANGQYVEALTDQRPGVPMPEEVRAIFERITKKMAMPDDAQQVAK